MPKVNLSGLNVEGLMALRKQIDVVLDKRRGELQKQLERIALLAGDAKVARRGGRSASALKGRKSRQNIGVRKARHGQDAVPDHVGLLPRSRRGRSSRIS